MLIFVVYLPSIRHGPEERGHTVFATSLTRETRAQTSLAAPYRVQCLQFEVKVYGFRAHRQVPELGSAVQGVSTGHLGCIRVGDLDSAFRGSRGLGLRVWAYRQKPSSRAARECPGTAEARANKGCVRECKARTHGQGEGKRKTPRRHRNIAIWLHSEARNKRSSSKRPVIAYGHTALHRAVIGGVPSIDRLQVGFDTLSSMRWRRKEAAGLAKSASTCQERSSGTEKGRRIHHIDLGRTGMHDVN
eukprot:3937396-Rhodomonas_salina.1